MPALHTINGHSPRSNVNSALCPPSADVLLVEQFARPFVLRSNGSKVTPNCDPCDWPLLRTTGRLQCRFKRFLTSRPEIISVKDNLVSGTVVAEPPLAATAVLANGFW
jgi:hypothetical protein